MKFKQFINEEAPAGGVPSSPTDPTTNKNTTNDNHFASVQQQFGIGDKYMKSALEGDPVQIWKVPDYSSSWGYLVIGPCTVKVKQISNNSYNLTFQLKEKQNMSPLSFVLPYKKGEIPIRYSGKVVDEKVNVTGEELQNFMTEPFSTAQAAPAPGGM